MKEEGTLPNSFYEISVALIPKPDEDTRRIGKYKQVSLMNIDVKILNSILANQVQQCIKRIIHHDQGQLTPRMQDGLVFLNKSCDTPH